MGDIKCLCVINVVCWLHVNTIVYYSQDIGSELAVRDNVNGGDIFILYAQHNNLHQGTTTNISPTACVALLNIVRLVASLRNMSSLYRKIYCPDNTVD